MKRAPDLDQTVHAKPRLVVVRCSQHDFLAVLADNATGGIRLTPSKCCGSWDEEVKSWTLSAQDWRDLARAAEFNAQMLEEIHNG